MKRILTCKPEQESCLAANSGSSNANCTLYRQTLDSYDGCYFFFDEVQYLKEWENYLKTMVDSYHDTKFVVSGSAAAALMRKSQESGAGRFTDFVLPPLTFAEFIDMTVILANARISSGATMNSCELPAALGPGTRYL